MKGNKIRMKSIRSNFEITPKSPCSPELVKEGIKAINAYEEDLKEVVQNNTGMELDPVMLRQIIACCYKNGMKNGEIAFRNIKENDLGREIVIFNSFMSGEGNSFITLGDMDIRKRQVLPAFPLKLFATVRKTPSILLFFRYFGALMDPDYDMSQNKAVLFY